MAVDPLEPSPGRPPPTLPAAPGLNPAAPPGATADASAAAAGRIERARRTVEDNWNRLVASRERVGSVDVAFQVFESDRAKGGGIMAGAVAFRTFVALVPATLVVIVSFGAVARLSDSEVDQLARDAGITGLAAKTIKSAADTSTTSAVVTLVLAAFALFLASTSLAKTLRIVNFLVWDLPLRPLKRSWRASLTVMGMFAALSVLTMALARAREVSGSFGLLATLAGMLGFLGLWLLVSWLLPHRGELWALLPGSILVAVGALGLQLVTVYYVSRKVDSWSQRYGGLGVAVVILGWLYLIGRLVVGSAALNAALWEHQSRSQGDPGEER